MSLINHFPVSEVGGEPRVQQVEALTFIENAFAADIKVVVVESPVGTGKSGVAITASRAYKGGIIAMPTIELQKQYLRDFKNTAPLIGRGRFPCLVTSSNALEAIDIIKEGKIPERPELDQSCAKAPCLNKPAKKAQAVKQKCLVNGGCPHQHSIDVAQESETIISNLHSLLYSVSLNEKIDKREVLIIDECHDLQMFMRDFLQVKFKIRRQVPEEEIKNLKTTDQWLDWLRSPKQMEMLTNQEAKDSYEARLERLEKIGDSVFKTWTDEKDGYLWLELWPIHIGNACQSLLFSLANKIILMSGTIYSKDLFLRPLGVDLDTAAFIRIQSDFPVKNRPVALPRLKNLDLSHKGWATNFNRAVKEIEFLMGHHSDQKGLIQTSSYRMTNEIVDALDSKRIMSHNSQNFSSQLQAFYDCKEPKVFISPVISQGVDFKEDLARWQILVRPSYAAISDPYISFLLDAGLWGVYNYFAAIVFGQQLGRVVRSNTDKGVTYLLSSTFNKLINKSGGLLPTWQKQGFIK